MTPERYTEIYLEVQNRVNQWLTHSSFDEMSIGGIKMRFDMSLGMFEGYPFEKPNWMIGFNKFVTTREFNSKEYEEIIDSFFNRLKQKEYAGN